ncbi:cell division protein CrgA [Nesterenkonia sp.]|uniref:cell division protein CrgA n=1 Tax=Nesterenkonia sp. TaxID=704201 RepID=UPI002630DA0F|nr:cell division protein CrgA [Nesterenkonia sp.]
MPESKHRKNRRRGQDAAAEASEASPLNSAEPFDFKDLEAEESTPRWYVATMVGLMIVGLLWLVTWYVTSGQLPLSAAGGWNVVIGFGVIMIGMFMAMRWK